MGWATLFAAVNAIALTGWALLLAGPRSPRMAAIILYFGVGLLCLCYALTGFGLFSGLADPARLPGTDAPRLFDYSIAGLRTLFLSDGGIVFGWAHYLAFDLFIGQWIAKDADHKGFGRISQLPILLLTLLAGPVGLLIWLVLREPRARAAAKA